MDVGHFYSPSTEAHHSSSRRASIKTMPKPKTTSTANPGVKSGTTPREMDTKGWRKKIGGKPKQSPVADAGADDTVKIQPQETQIALDCSDGYRYGWRTTVAASRPVTPPVPLTPNLEDVEDTRSERSKFSTPRRDSRPKLIRYMSLFASHKEDSAGLFFSEPWHADGPPVQVDPWSYTDPIVAMETIHSHMCKNSKVPIPLQYNSGLFRVFDDYRKLRTHKELLEKREQETIKHLRQTKAMWLRCEESYKAEIRRLELLIARGPPGMTGLMKVRQGTVVNPAHRHRRPMSKDRETALNGDLSPNETDKEIKERSQRIPSYRPTSPSSKMVALSRQLTDHESLGRSVEKSEERHRKFMLPQGGSGELNLADIRGTDPAQCFAQAFKHHTLYTTRHTPSADFMKDLLAGHMTECDALNALKELGALVARYKGLEASYFVDGLLSFFASEQSAKSYSEHDENSRKVQMHAAEEDEKLSARQSTIRLPYREFQSHPERAHQNRRQRHFSFELGADQIPKRGADVDSRYSHSQIDSAGSESSSWPETRFVAKGLHSNNKESTLLLSSLSADFPRPSMIPSPVRMVGRMRRENSLSSLQSVFLKSAHDERRNSRTSIQTVFREATSANPSIKSKCRGSSDHDLRAVDSTRGSKERLDQFANRQRTTVLAPAQVVSTSGSNRSA